MAFERKCLLCGTTYRYCSYCDDFRYEPSWKVMFHDGNCNTIFNTLQLHSIGDISNEEAVKRLKACDLTVLKNATEAINSQVKAILDTEVKEEVKPVLVVEQAQERKKPVEKNKQNVYKTHNKVMN